MTWYLMIATSKKISPFAGADKMRGEFAVVEQLKALSEDIEAHAPSQITFERTGKKRFPEPRESIYFPNYVFAQIPDEWFYQAVQCQGVSPTVMRIHPHDVSGLRRDAEGNLVHTGTGVEEAIQRAAESRTEAEKIIADIEKAKKAREEAKTKAEHEKAKAEQRRARLKMINYEPGDMLDILGGPFAGQAARFKRMVQFANEVQPSLEVEIEAFGGWVPGQIDPLDVKRRA